MTKGYLTIEYVDQLQALVILGIQPGNPGVMATMTCEGGFHRPKDNTRLDVTELREIISAHVEFGRLVLKVKFQSKKMEVSPYADRWTMTVARV